jgi:hypothetical protein
LFCTKYQKNYIVGKLEIKPIEWEYLKNENWAPWTSNFSYLDTTAVLLCSHDAASTWPASHVQNYRSLTQFFAPSKLE